MIVPAEGPGRIARGDEVISPREVDLHHSLEGVAPKQSMWIAVVVLGVTVEVVQVEVEEAVDWCEERFQKIGLRLDVALGQRERQILETDRRATEMFDELRKVSMSDLERRLRERDGKRCAADEVAGGHESEVLAEVLKLVARPNLVEVVEPAGTPVVLSGR